MLVSTAIERAGNQMQGGGSAAVLTALKSDGANTCSITGYDPTSFPRYLCGSQFVLVRTTGPYAMFQITLNMHVHICPQASRVQTSRPSTTCCQMTTSWGLTACSCWPTGCATHSAGAPGGSELSSSSSSRIQHKQHPICTLANDEMDSILQLHYKLGTPDM